MTEIHPISPSTPIVKPIKINRDDHHPPPDRQQRESKPEQEPQDLDPVQHIDEIV